MKHNVSKLLRSTDKQVLGSLPTPAIVEEKVQEAEGEIRQFNDALRSKGDKKEKDKASSPSTMRIVKTVVQKWNLQSLWC